MNEDDLQVGELVLSLKGRDSSNYYIVLATKDGYVYYVDGNVRKINRPKRKKLKHISRTNIICSDIKEKLNELGKISDKEIRESIKDNVQKIKQGE